MISSIIKKQLEKLGTGARSQKGIAHIEADLVIEIEASLRSSVR